MDARSTLKSIKDHFAQKKITFADDLMFALIDITNDEGPDGDGPSQVRLADLREALIKSKDFKLSEEDIDFLCTTANDTCYKLGIDENQLETWIDVPKFLSLF